MNRCFDDGKTLESSVSQSSYGDELVFVNSFDAVSNELIKAR